jgi:hypothetical protein
MPLNPVGGGPVVAVRIWPGSGSANVTGKTAFALFDDDDEFAETAPQLAKWVCSTLGYPIVSVELEDSNIYANFEKATMAFASIVNEFNMRDNMMMYQGMSTGSSFSQKLLKSSPVPYIVKLSADYGTEAMSGGTVDVKRGYVTMQKGQQEYDLQSLWAAVSESGNRIEIKRVFHERVPAMQRFFDPFAGTGTDLSSLLGSFGWQGFAVASNFLVMPTYETILRAQAIELNDQIRRSNYSFEIRNNKLRLYPVVSDDTAGDRVWFEYIVERDKFRSEPSGSVSGKLQSGVVSDYSNVPFAYVPFGDINDVGRDWIYRYTLALCKITLGYVRNKYDSLPIPNAEVRLDGDRLRQEGQAEIERLEQYLRETLEQTGKKAQMEKQKENEINAQEILKRVPTNIYVF